MANIEGASLGFHAMNERELYATIQIRKRQCRRLRAYAGVLWCKRALIRSVFFVAGLALFALPFLWLADLLSIGAGDVWLGILAAIPPGVLFYWALHRVGRWTALNNYMDALNAALREVEETLAAKRSSIALARQLRAEKS